LAISHKVRGAIHYPLITVKLVDDKVVGFDVGAWGETDFSLERLPLDKK
jgi:hypothetical protein